MTLLQPPKKTTAGCYYLALTTPASSPEIRWAAGTWIAPQDAVWQTWADQQRKELLGEMLSHGNWFSRPPRHDILDPLFTPWLSRKMDGSLTLACRTPQTPGAEGSSGSAIWQLDGLLMSSTAIDPVWSIHTVTPDDNLDQISLFGDGETVDGEVDTDAAVAAVVSAAAADDSETREIQIEEIADAPDSGAPPLVLRTREWETRKFLAKERVREARLKAQIAEHMAAKEEQRFYNLFGDLEDGESRFSDYDLSDAESNGGRSVDLEELEQEGGAGAGAGQDRIRHV